MGTCATKFLSNTVPSKLENTDLSLWNTLAGTSILGFFLVLDRLGSLKSNFFRFLEFWLGETLSRFSLPYIFNQLHIALVACFRVFLLDLNANHRVLQSN